MTAEHDGVDRPEILEGQYESHRAGDKRGRENLDQAVERLAQHFRAKPNFVHMARALTLMMLGEYKGPTYPLPQ